MPIPSKINNHLDQFEEEFPSQFRDKPNIYKLMQNVVEKVQDIEDLFWSIFEGTKFFKAKGVNLDRYGLVLGKPRPAGLEDPEYFILLAGEVIARSSDGTVDGIRKRLEAVLGVFKTNIILLNNTITWRDTGNYPALTGGVFVYGYTQDPTRRLTGTEGDILKAACPVTTATAIYGQHFSPRSLRISRSSLWIPCEIILPAPQYDIISTDNIPTDIIAVRADNFKAYGKGWESGMLAEHGSFSEEALIDSTDAEDLLEIESRDYDNNNQYWADILQFQSEGYSADRGVLLEVSQST
jgi:hypothetical protein